MAKDIRYLLTQWTNTYWAPTLCQARGMGLCHQWGPWIRDSVLINQELQPAVRAALHGSVWRRGGRCVQQLKTGSSEWGCTGARSGQSPGLSCGMQAGMMAVACSAWRGGTLGN